MPTELFCASLASCFCLAVGLRRAQARRSRCRGSRVTVRARARRAASCATSSSTVDTRGRARRRDARARWSSARGRFCWVSNTLAAGVEVEYRRTSLATPVSESKQGPWHSRTSPSSAEVLRRARATWARSSPATPTACARGSTSSPPASPAIDDPEAQGAASRTLVADNARHMLLFRERAAAHGVDPDAYTCPDEGEAIYERIDELDGARRAARLRARLARPLRRAAVGLPRPPPTARTPRRSTPSAPTSTRMRGRAAARWSAPAPSGSAAEAHELYRVRELVETPRYAHAA